MNKLFKNQFILKTVVSIFCSIIACIKVASLKCTFFNPVGRKADGNKAKEHLHLWGLKCLICL